MMDELWREEEKKTLERIAKLTELGKVKWECVEYNPLCFMNEDKVDETSAYLCQMFTLTSEIGGMPYELEIAEYITVPDGKGDIALTLTRDVPDDFMKIDSILSSDVDEYENCEPSEIGKRYKNDPAMRLTEAIVPVVIESEAVQDTFEWARFINENGIADEILNHPVVRLAEKAGRKRTAHRNPAPPTTAHRRQRRSARGAGWPSICRRPPTSSTVSTPGSAI